MKVIAIVAQKGGTGKTTTAGAIAGYLSEHRKRTLVIDLNDQGDLTDTLGADTATSGALKVLTGGPIIGTAAETNLTSVDILTGAEELARAETLISLTGRERAMILKNALRPVRRYYSYCVIDAPGAFNTAMLNTLAAADSVIIPAKADFYSLRGIKRLTDNIQAVKQDINPDLIVAGILLTQYQGRRNLSRDIVEILQGAETALQTKLFNTKIRENSKIAEAPGRRESVLTYAPGSIGAADYRAFLTEYFNNITGGKL